MLRDRHEILDNFAAVIVRDETIAAVAKRGLVGGRRAEIGRLAGPACRLRVIASLDRFGHVARIEGRVALVLALPTRRRRSFGGLRLRRALRPARLGIASEPSRQIRPYAVKAPVLLFAHLAVPFIPHRPCRPPPQTSHHTTP